MSPLYHLQVGSFLAHSRELTSRERRLVMLASLAPDLDGIFFWNRELWDRFHHTFGHNIFFAVLIGGLFAALGRRPRLPLFALCFISALLQVVIDNVTNDPSWQIMYFWPVSTFDFSLGHFIAWEHLEFCLKIVVQGAFMIGILAGTVVLYRRTGMTFLELVSPRVDRLLTDFLVLPFTARCAHCPRRAFYRESATGEPLCREHGRPRWNLAVERLPGDGQGNGPDD